MPNANYDASGNNTSVVDPRNQTTSYQYDALNRVTKITDPLSYAIDFSYDPNGNLRKQAMPTGSTIYFTYDPRNLRTRTTYKTVAPDVTAGLRPQCYYVYDEVGNVTAMGDLGGLHTIRYDPRNLVSKHRYSFSGGPSVYFQYDGNRNLTSLVYPGAAGVLQSGFDARNRQRKLQSPSGGAAYFAYSLADQPTERLLPNGVKLTASYDSAGRLSRWRYTDASGGELAKWVYTRDAKGLPRKVVREGNRSIYYEYDAADRLTAELWRNNASEIYAFRYAYDLAGNRTRCRRNGVNTYYEYDADNRLTKRGSNATLTADQVYYTYDDNGSLIKQYEVIGAKTTYFSYNAAGLIAGITFPDGTTNTFAYDANLQRYAMVENNEPSYFLWDGLNILQERAADGTVKVQNANCITSIPGIAQLVESRRPAEASGNQNIYPIMDVRGSITKWMKADGTTILAQREYDAFGVVLEASGFWPSRFGYQGQTWIELSNAITLSPARVYSVTTGLFTSTDPFGWYTDRVPQHALGSWRMRRPFASVSPKAYRYVAAGPTASCDVTGFETVNIVSPQPLPHRGLPSLSLHAVAGTPSSGVTSPTISPATAGDPNSTIPGISDSLMTTLLEHYHGGNGRNLNFSYDKAFARWYMQNRAIRDKIKPFLRDFSNAMDIWRRLSKPVNCGPPATDASIVEQQDERIPINAFEFLHGATPAYAGLDGAAFWIGGHTLRLKYYCHAVIDCCNCDFEISCSSAWTFRDYFNNPYDLLNFVPHDVNVNINGIPFWYWATYESEPLRWRGKGYPGCSPRGHAFGNDWIARV